MLNSDVAAPIVSTMAQLSRMTEYPAIVALLDMYFEYES